MGNLIAIFWYVYTTRNLQRLVAILYIPYKLQLLLQKKYHAHLFCRKLPGEHFNLFQVPAQWGVHSRNWTNRYHPPTCISGFKNGVILGINFQGGYIEVFLLYRIEWHKRHERCLVNGECRWNKYMQYPYSTLGKTLKIRGGLEHFKASFSNK